LAPELGRHFVTRVVDEHQDVLATISGRVVRESALGDPQRKLAAYLAAAGKFILGYRPSDFVGLAFLPALRVPLGFAGSGADLLMFSLSIAFSLLEFLLVRVCGRHMDHSGSEKWHAESLAIR